MAYSLSNRFAAPPKHFPFYDPGTYQFEKCKLKMNTAPFLSNVARKTGDSTTLWTQALYDVPATYRIPNITSLKSKQKRFAYEAFNEEDLKEILCECGVENTCVCPDENEPSIDIMCQSKVRRCLYKGPIPRSSLGDEGVSIPSRTDQGYKINTCGSQKRVKKEINASPPFYDARVKEFTLYYQGCKWSRRTSKRINKHIEVTPGPADYYFEREPDSAEICIDKLRAFKRKTSKQPRFMELVQQQNIQEARPGPASYSPSLSKGTELKFIGPKAQRLLFSKNVEFPGPAEYELRRTFDPVVRPDIPCQAVLPDPAVFGIKSQRFKNQAEEGPSPATYNVTYKVCQFMHCPTAPFGTAAVRFKSEFIDECDEEEIAKEYKKESSMICPTPTSVFKSKTPRIKPLLKKMDEPSPADILFGKRIKNRSSCLQYAAPFYSSDGRFQPWHNWIPVHGKIKTPTPCDYNASQPKCLPAFNRGPMFRTKRFPADKYITPAPNEYDVSYGTETILKTHNKRLIDNVENQHKFVWHQPVQNRTLNYEQKEALLIQKCINLLDANGIFENHEQDISVSADVTNKIKDEKASKRETIVEDEIKREENKSKMLRSFLYARQIPNYF